MSSRRSFSITRSKKKEPVPKKNLVSSELAMKIIEAELELEKSLSSGAIHKLIALYSQAIEYYEQENNPRYYDFQDRMHKMLIRPQIIAILQRVNCTESSISDSTMTVQTNVEKTTEEKFEKITQKTQKKDEKFENNSEYLEIPQEINPMYLRKEQAEITRKQMSRELNINLSKPKTQKNFNIIIERHSSTSKETAQKAAADFKSQDSAIERRLASRKKAQLSKSMSFYSYGSNDISKVFGCDLSDVDEEHNNSSTKSSFFTIDEQVAENVEKFEKKLEEIMEKNFNERSIKIAELKFRYESQINEIAGMGDIMDLLIKQMKTNMQEEIDALIQEYDLKRREEIKKLKEEISY